MLDVYSTYVELVTVPPELNISQNAFNRISDIANDTTEHFDNFDEFELYVEHDIDQLENDDSNIGSIVDVNQIQSKNDALLQSIESNLLGLFKTYAFGIATMISSRQSTQVQNIQYFGLGNPKPDWLVEYMKALRRSLLNIHNTTSIATDILRQISIFDFLQTQNNELIKLLSPAMTPQSLKDYSDAKALDSIF